MKALNFEELRHTGVLWYLNRVAFHPHGLALGLVCDDPDGEPVGWTIMKSPDGLWSFEEDADMEGLTNFNNFMKEVEAENETD